jgi:DNA-binding MarR family transcriptional regulator
LLRVSTDDLADDLLRHAARLSRWANRTADMPLPWSTARTLSLVEELGPARVTTLAEADEVSQPTMTNQLQRLEADGLVSRVPDPADARAALVSLTAAGADALAATRRARGAALERVLAAVAPSEAELRTAVTLLAGLVEATRPSPGHEPALAGARDTASHRKDS